MAEVFDPTSLSDGYYTMRVLILDDPFNDILYHEHGAWCMYDHHDQWEDFTADDIRRFVASGERDVPVLISREQAEELMRLADAEYREEFN